MLSIETTTTAANTRIKVAFCTKPEFTNNCIVVVRNGNDATELLEFHSATLGVAKWSGKGLIECHSWEAEDDLINLSYVSKNYQSNLYGAEGAPDYAALIVAECLENLPIPEVQAYAKSFVEGAELEFFDVMEVEQFVNSFNKSKKYPGLADLKQALLNKLEAEYGIKETALKHLAKKIQRKEDSETRYNQWKEIIGFLLIAYNLDEQKGIKELARYSKKLEKMTSPTKN